MKPASLAAIGRISPEGEVPVTFCNEEYQRFRHRSAMPAYVCFFATLVLINVPSDWPGIGWARGVSFGALMAFGIADLFKREKFFNAIACPHCRKPAGELVRREGFNLTRCSHCGREGQTDLRLSWWTGPASQRWPR